MPELFTVVDARTSGSEQSIVNEAHVIGEDGTPNFLWLNELPLESTGVTIAGKTEVTGTPNDNEFRVYYDGMLAGLVEFNAADDGESIAPSYDGRGTVATARDINRLVDRLQGQVTLTSAATVVIPLVLDGHRQFYIELTHAADFQLPATAPDGVTFDLLIANNVSGLGGPYAPTFASADFDFGSAGAPTLPTDADVFHFLGFATRGNVALFLGIRGGYAV
jgi:hypothetical protein